ncbi:uncharacterized protein LOC110719025 [Chenopodium quinoa]|uniref:uncharacterized protein LOC110719025 n=1 Tax=Chenopodium quinoa TaxID=63459 RepID=UPI000B76FB98|nr:uncharacterized protein LOC110719025 [Chenopodium quinoa]
MAGDESPPPPPPPKIETNSPFYLGAHDRPGDFITPIRLKLDNFDAWSHAIYVALSSRRKFGFLDGTITDCIPPAIKEDWVVIHCMLVSWLMNTIDPEVKSLLSNYDNAKRLWDDLHERFCVINGPRIQNLKAQINKCEQPKNMTVVVYFGKLNVLWDELAKLEPLINCKLTNKVSQDELVRGLDRVREEPVQAAGFAVRTGQPCGREGADRGASGSVCAKCKKGGHETSRCWSDKVFSSEQWKAITGLFGNVNVFENHLSGKFDVTSWIIDTGATHHVTGDASWLFDTRPFECPVGLPNGDTVVASLIGSVRLSDKLTLTGVLYVPNLSCSLLSVSQLAKDLNCTVYFNPYMCAIQDQAKELIGTGARRDGLYYFSNSDSVHHVGVVGAISNLKLWHRRMGHPSEKVVKLLPHVSSNKDCLVKGCEVCMRAKHPRNKFPLSDSRASRIF